MAVITGGANGIGASTARLFARHGAKVIVADIENDKGQELCRDILEDGGTASYIRCDVSREADVKAAVDTALKSHGRLDIMLNNAGIVTDYHPFVDVERSVFERVMAVNVIGVFLGLKHAGRAMASAGSGSIVNTASCASVMAAMSVPQYTASKHAVVGLTRDAAVQLGRSGVRVNCVSPLVVASPMAVRALGLENEAIEAAAVKSSVLKAAPLKTEDVAETMLFLASDESRYINGHNLVVDGGYTTTNPSLAAQFYSTA